MNILKTRPQLHYLALAAAVLLVAGVGIYLLSRTEAATVLPQQLSASCNAARGKTVTRISGENGQYVIGTPASLVDGNYNTMYYNGFWSQEVVINLGAATDLSELRLVWKQFGKKTSGSTGQDYINNYFLRVSKDGTNYTTVAAVSNKNPMSDYLAVKGTWKGIRYLRVGAGSSVHWIGVFEIEALKTSCVPKFRAGDINRDGRVNTRDLSLLLAGWSRSGTSDLNRDGRTSTRDLSILLRNWTN